MRALPWLAGLSLACGQPAGFQFEAQVATIAGNPFGLVDEDRESEATGRVSWHTSARDVDPSVTRGEFPIEGDGVLELDLRGGEITIRGSGWPVVEVMERSIRFSDGIDIFQVGRPMTVNGVEDRDVAWVLAMSHDSMRFDPEVLPEQLPDYEEAAWSHTFSVTQGEGTALLRFTSLENWDGR